MWRWEAEGEGQSSGLLLLTARPGGYPPFVEPRAAEWFYTEVIIVSVGTSMFITSYMFDTVASFLVLDMYGVLVIVVAFEFRPRGQIAYNPKL